MASGIGTVEIRRDHGALVVQGLGKTPRGQKFIRAQEALGVKKMSDPDFKGKLKSAVDVLLAPEVSTP